MKSPKLRTKQGVYNYVCWYIETVAKFKPPMQDGKLSYFDAKNKFSSPAGCLFKAHKLKPVENTTYIGETKKCPEHAILKRLRKDQGLDPKQKIDVVFLEDLEEAVENLSEKDIVSNERNTIKTLKRVAKKYKLESFNFG